MIHTGQLQTPTQWRGFLTNHSNICNLSILREHLPSILNNDSRTDMCCLWLSFLRHGKWTKTQRPKESWTDAIIRYRLHCPVAWLFFPFSQIILCTWISLHCSWRDTYQNPVEILSCGSVVSSNAYTLISTCRPQFECLHDTVFRIPNEKVTEFKYSRNCSIWLSLKRHPELMLWDVRGEIDNWKQV